MKITAAAEKMMKSDLSKNILRWTAVLMIALLFTSCGQVPQEGPSGGEPQALPEPEVIPDPEVSFSAPSGSYPDGLTLELSAPEGCAVYYTTDCTLPDESATPYTGPITLEGSGEGWLTDETVAMLHPENVREIYATEELADAWIIRAVAVREDGTCSPVVTKTYFTDPGLAEEAQGILTVSIVTEPDSLLSYEDGIMVTGRIFDEWAVKEGSSEIIENESLWHQIVANYTQKGKEWERPASMELFGEDGLPGAAEDCGLRIHGTASRMIPHRSLRLYFREKYGSEYLNYDLFGDGITEYDVFVLRNGGNTGTDLIFKDSWQQDLLSGRRFVTSRYRMAQAFLNGEYWGNFCLLERYTVHDMQERFGVGDILIVKDGEFEDGNEDRMDLYEELMSYQEKDLTDPAVWEAFRQIVDVEELAEYLAAEIYMANYDFYQSKNDILWRTVEADGSAPYGDGKWHFILYDTDFTSGLYGYNTRWNTDSLPLMTERSPLYAAVLENSEFRELFLEAVRSIGSEDLAAERVNATLDEWAALWEPWMPKQWMRFEGTEEQWNGQIAVIRNFYTKRYDYIVPRLEALLG